LIERGVCICGNKINKGTKEFDILNDLLKNNNQVSKRSFLLDDRPDMVSIMNNLKKDLPERFKNILENKSRERIKNENNQKKLKEISNQLINSQDEEIGNIEKTIQCYQDERDSCFKNIGQEREQLIQIESQINTLKDKLDKLNSLKKQTESSQKIYKILETSYLKLTEIREHITQQVLKSVSNHTNEFFKELIWKKDDFEYVKFGEDYRVEVVKRDEKLNSLEILSTGEMKVLSLATLKALAQMSGFDYMPVFIDGPLENLDEEVRQNFLNMLPSFFINKQIFIFSLDSEKIIDFGKKHIDPENFFRLSRYDNSTSTIIKKFDFI